MAIEIKDKIDEIKPVIRSILLALGRRATEREFRTEYFNQEGESFNEFLRGLGMTFYAFAKSIPDVCNVRRVLDEVVIERVSTAGSSHMDNLTIEKKKKKVPKTVLYQNYQGFGSSSSRFGSSLVPRQPYSNIHRSSSRPSTSAGTSNKPAYSLPTAKAKTSVQSRLTQCKPATTKSTSTASSYKTSAAAAAEYKALINSLPPALHQTMSKVTVKPTDSTTPTCSSSSNTESQNRSECNPSNEVSMMEISDDDTEWSDEEFEESYRTEMLGIKTVKASAKLVAAKKPVENEPKRQVQDQQSSAPQVPPQSSARPLVFQIPPQTSAPLSVPQRSPAPSVPERLPQPSVPQVPMSPTVETSSTNPFKAMVDKENRPENSVPQLKLSLTQLKQEIDDLDQQIYAQLKPELPRPQPQPSVIRIPQLPPPTKPTVIDNGVSETLKNYHLMPFRIPNAIAREMKMIQRFQVELVEFSSPSQFMFQYNRAQLMVLTEEMNLHYKSLELSRHLKVFEAIPGMCVAVYDDSNWQRAEIVSVRDSTVFLNFVDTGSKKNLDASNLRYLDKYFAAAPRKCYNGSLFGVKPTDGRSLWMTGAIMKFMAKTKGKLMYATIKGQLDGFYQLSLVESNIEKTKIEDYLVEMGLAVKDLSLDYSKNLALI